MQSEKAHSTSVAIKGRHSARDDSCLMTSPKKIHFNINFIRVRTAALRSIRRAKKLGHFIM